MYEIDFKKYSDMSSIEKSKINYLKIKRIVLRAFKIKRIAEDFNYSNKDSALNFAIDYFDIRDKIKLISISKIGVNIMNPRTIRILGPVQYHGINRNKEDIMTDILCSIYEDEPAKFQTFLSFILKESNVNIKLIDFHSFFEELKSIGYGWDGELLKSVSDVPFVEKHINSILEEKLQNIDPELLNTRKGAIEAILSNSPDKTRHVAASCRALINNLMKALVPDTALSSTEGKIKQRIQKILGSESEVELVDKTVAFIQALNSIQAKGDHSKTDEPLAYLILDMTDKLSYFLLTRIKD